MALLAAVGSGCGDGDRQPLADRAVPVTIALAAQGGTASSLSISLPNTEPAQRIALGAGTNLTVSDRSKVVETAGGLSTVSSVGTEQTQLGVSANLGNVWSKPSVFLQSNAAISGFLNLGGSVTQQTGVSIAGPIAQTTITTNTALTTWTVTFPQSGANVLLQPSQQITLAPGGYGSLSAPSGAQVKLSAGTYFFTTIDLEPSAQLIVDETAGPVLIYVQTSLLYKGSISHVGGGAGDLLIGCTGCSVISLQGPFSGTLVAPLANLTLTTVTGGHTGSFFANRITVNPDITVTHQTFRHWDVFTSPSCPTGAAPATQVVPFSLCNGGIVGRLPPVIDPVTSQRVVNGFRWSQAPALPNFGADGNPTLWYAWIYVRDKKDLEVLDDLEIQWDTMPLFDVERDLYAGMTGETTSTFDGQGGFVFAVIPGGTYNLIREAALCSDPNQAVQMFLAVVLQKVPVSDAANADGSLSYQFLATDGFRYRGLPNCPSDDQLPPDTTVPEGACDSPFLNPPAGGDPVLNAMKSAPTGSGLTIACSPPPDTSGSVQQPWGLHIGGLVKSILSGAHKVAHGLSDLARKGLAGVSKFFKGSTTLTVNLQVMNSDPGFGASNTMMLRAWGVNRGKPIPLPGVTVRALQQISFSLHPSIPSVKIPGTNISTPKILFPPVNGTIPFDSLSTGTTNASGVATIKVVKSSTTGICVELHNAAAQMNDWVTPEEACSFKNPILSASQLQGPTTIPAPLAGDLVNDFAQLSEAYTYLHDVVGYTPKQVNVLTGSFANLLSSGGRAYTPCFGYASTDDIVGAIGSKLGTAGGAFVGNKVETYFKDAAEATSESFDSWADAASKWAAAAQQAANTAAAQAVANANAAVNAALQAITSARQAVGAAAEAAATLTEAADRLTILQSQGASSQQISDASQAVTNAVNALKTASDAAQQAEQNARTAASDALNTVSLAYSAAANTAAAAAVNTAAEAARLAGSTLAFIETSLGAGANAVLPLIGSAVGTILGFVVGEVADVVYDGVDMVLPSGFSTVSRGVTSHEYGHFAFCDMMYRTDPGKFSSAWINAASDTIVTQLLKRDGSTVPDYYMNEGIADFWAAQFAGGVGYFSPAGGIASNVSGWAPLGGDPMTWCSAANQNPLRCIEDNWGAIAPGGQSSPKIAGTNTVKQVSIPNPKDPFSAAVAFTTTTIHDAFDGWPNSPVANVPGNGAAWVTLTDTSGMMPVYSFAAPVPPFVAPNGFFAVIGSLNDTAESGMPIIHEENVLLPGSAFPLIISEWLRREPSVLATLNPQTFFSGMTQVMLNFATSSDEVCRLYDLHQATDTCPSYGPSGATSAPPPPLFICPSGTTLTNGQCTTSITPPG